MNKITKYLSFELVFTLLFLLAFSLPWLDLGILLKMNGWQIPTLKTKMTKFTNIFVANKSFIYTTHAVYIVPILSIVATMFTTFAKRKAARLIMAITGVLAIIISIMLRLQLPKSGSGVLLLGAVGLLATIYAIIALRRSKTVEEKDGRNIP